MFNCFTSYRGWIVLGLAILAGGYLAIWHGAHVAAALPLLVIFACPLMHIFMHRRHGHHAKHGASPDDASQSSPASTDGGRNGKA